MRAADSINTSNETLQLKLSRQVPDKQPRKQPVLLSIPLQRPALSPESSLLSQTNPTRNGARQTRGDGLGAH